jgi:hypothetical protein
MLSSPNLPILSPIRPTALSLTSSISLTSLTTQTLPTFSTPSKHRAHTNARNSIPFMRLLHSSLYTHFPRRHLPSIRLFHSGLLCVNHNPFVCHSYKKHPGGGGAPRNFYKGIFVLRWKRWNGGKRTKRENQQIANAALKNWLVGPPGFEPGTNGL